LADPIKDLLSLAATTPDPRLVSNWISAYLGKRPLESKREILRKLDAEFAAREANANEKRAAGMIRRCVQKVGENLRP
jgi:replicative superfamily II helicase